MISSFFFFVVLKLILFWSFFHLPFIGSSVYISLDPGPTGMLKNHSGPLCLRLNSGRSFNPSFIFGSERREQSSLVLQCSLEIRMTDFWLVANALMSVNGIFCLLLVKVDCFWYNNILHLSWTSEPLCFDVIFLMLILLLFYCKK